MVGVLQHFQCQTDNNPSVHHAVCVDLFPKAYPLPGAADFHTEMWPSIWELQTVNSEQSQ